MRQLPRDEAAVLHAFKALLGATVVRQGLAPAFDEKRNTSRVFPVAHDALDNAREALRDLDNEPEQLSI